MNILPVRTRRFLRNLVGYGGLVCVCFAHAQPDETQVLKQPQEGGYVAQIAYAPSYNASDRNIISQPPQQTKLAKTEFVYKNGYQLTLLDNFAIHARVLSRRIYLGDPRADIAPVDMAVGWGKMSDQDIIQHINFKQNRRFLFWHVDEFPLPRKELEASASNLHLIPADGAIERQIKSATKGQIVSMSGYLVDVKAPDDFVWATSRSREDSGDGACEILLVTDIKIKPL
jgi:hypothetical protein